MPAFAPETRPLRAVIYCRVSSDPTGQQLSVKSQERFCRNHAKAHGIEVIRVFVDNDIGASTYSLKDRPDFLTMVEWLTDGADVNILIAWTANRTTRNMREYLDLRDLCADRALLYSYSGKTYDMRRTDDRFATGLDALLAERGADEIHTNLLQGKETAALKGRPAGRLLWGTIREYDTYRALVAVRTHPEIGRYLRYLFDARWFRKVPKYRIAKVFTRARLRTPQPPMLKLPKSMPKAEKRRLREEAWDQQPWDDAMVTKILDNPAYAGYQVHKGEIIGDSMWEGIVSKERWHALQERDRVPADSPVKPRERRVRHLQTGSMECTACVSGVMRRTVTRGSEKLSCKKCFGTSVKMELADTAVVDLLMLRFAKPDALTLLRPASSNAARATALAEYDRLTRRLNEIKASVIEGQFDVTFGAEAAAQLAPKIEAARVASLPPPPLPDFIQALAVPDPRRVWNKMPIETRRATVRMLLRVRLKPDPRPGRVVTPIHERLEISWRELP